MQDERHGAVRDGLGGGLYAVYERVVFVEDPAFLVGEDGEEDFEVFFLVGVGVFGLPFDGGPDGWIDHG